MAHEPLIFRVHAIQHMPQRGINVEDVRQVLDTGEVIENYPDDCPYPSALVLGWVRGQPIPYRRRDHTCRENCDHRL
jgi:uncharacterized protein DUF4258